MKATCNKESKHESNETKMQQGVAKQKAIVQKRTAKETLKEKKVQIEKKSFHDFTHG